MYKALASPGLFAMTYLIAVMPNLAYSGIVENGLSLISLSIASIMYVLSMIVIWAICIIRGMMIGKKWLVLIPTVAFLFDLIPALTTIQAVPYIYHLLAIIIGAASPTIVKIGLNTRRMG